ncbi:hypothetical protein A2Z33_03445 [Candidatus Gottesmanbacteria bacterium RBG_16_52_11]|uniref:Phosphatidate cytidylyltransferase n=1 Tax=Candidatus Gottesmanbacteria bacterium RBG_16_52_11 TaxID=1798374 RepID=A0A1F5YVR1_9BACT|nr:MAG: hypothetical protein A2Z33_03445 [Candidatus Gottesmanbacteria bacterium RBG_16_52_11]
MLNSIITPLKTILTRKPPIFVLVPFVFAAIIVLLKWGITPVAPAVFFLAGTGLGIYFMDIAEVFFRLQPSPFRTAVFCAGFAVVAAFVVSSTGSAFASGLVFAVYITLLLWQLGEFSVAGHLGSWYEMFVGRVSRDTQLAGLGIFILFFAVITWIFLH